MPSHDLRCARICGVVVLILTLTASGRAADSPAATTQQPVPETAKSLAEYYRQMSAPQPFLIRTGPAWETHRRQLQDFLLNCAGLQPLPERVPLDVHLSEPLDHPWCTVRRVYYQLWPGVYSSGLLFMPKQFRERPAPAMLCPHGHWDVGNAHPDVQKRCLNFARLGYVTFSSTQHHYEDLTLGVSHQTLMIWNNMRALDYLESLPEVDKLRVGAAGESGGGLQTQMLVALDARVKAATIVGLTCDFRQIMFPDSCHCACNHFPRVMRRTDHPEISTLGLPAALQYLTMNDWTRTFEADNFPTIQKLYAAHGVGERAFCKYFNTGHDYDRTKREYAYWWMERWLSSRPVRVGVSAESRDANGSAGAAPSRADVAPVPEPETVTFPCDTLQKLTAEVPGHKGFAELSRIYRAARGYQTPPMATVADWQAYRTRQAAALQQLLGEQAVLPRQPVSIAEQPPVPVPSATDETVVEQLGFPSEGPIVIPTTLLRPAGSAEKLPVLIVLAAGGQEALLADTGEQSPRSLARQGSLVVLPEVRTFGKLFSTGTKNVAAQRNAWERNGIVWGRPIPGLTATDLRAVLDGVLARADADRSRVSVVVRRSGDLAIGALFAMGLDARVTSADLDFAGACFEKRNLPMVACVLQHGDVWQWAALAADRQLALRHIPPEAGSATWLKQVFAAAGNPAGLELDGERGALAPFEKSLPDGP